MKKILIIAGFLILGVSAQAQNGPRYERKGPPSEEMINKAKEHLELSDEQFEQWKQLHAEFGEQMKELNRGEREKAENLREEFEEKVAAILNEEQLAKFKEHHEKRGKGKHGKHKG